MGIDPPGRLANKVLVKVYLATVNRADCGIRSS